MDFGVDFGQKVDLTASIRNILRNYPEGTAILKVTRLVTPNGKEVDTYAFLMLTGAGPECR